MGLRGRIAGFWRRTRAPFPLRLPAQRASSVFGFDRGTPVDRWYVERFLAAHGDCLRGDALEFGDATYLRRFGASGCRHHVLHARPGNPLATLVGDLETGSGLPDNAFDAIIATQVLPFLYHTAPAAANLARMLRPGGVALLSVCGISPISRYDEERWGDYWRFTPRSFRRLLDDAFPGGVREVTAWGNVQVASGFLYGMAAEEFSTDELLAQDGDFPLVMTARVEKALT
jgi:SAM-dependent methyltransferase